MKNHYQENLKKSAKLYHRNKRNSNFFRGLIQFHKYNLENPSTLSWWDEVDFIINDYRVKVAWIHPRFAYQNFIEAEAVRKISHPGINMDDVFSQATPNYVKAGKARKNVKSYTVNKYSQEFEDWPVVFKQAVQEIHNSVIRQVEPLFIKQWQHNGCLVNICAPIEVLGEEDLVKLVTLVKRLLIGETNLHDEFSGYIYSKEQWLIEDKEALYSAMDNATEQI